MIRSPLSDSRILVVGGAGFIGSHMIDRLWEEGAQEVVVIDNLFCGVEANLDDSRAKGTILYKDDAEIRSSLEYILDRHQIKTVFNCATKALNYSFLNPANAFTTNVDVVINLLELQRRKVFKTLCHFSTSEVYGTAIYEPMDEGHPRNPTTVYAAGKAAADLAVESYVRMFDVDAFIVRPFNNYGPRQNWRDYLAGLIPATVRRLMEGQRPIIEGTGEQSRDFIFVRDTVDAVMKLYPVMKPGDTTNVSTDGQISVNQVITAICGIVGYTGEMDHQPPRAADVMCHNASNQKLRSLIDLQLTPFSQGLQETVRWYANVFGTQQ